MVGDQCNASGKMIFISLIGWTFRFKIMEILNMGIIYCNLFLR